MVDRNKYDIGIFFVNDYRQTETLIPIIKNNIYTPTTILNDNEGGDEENWRTRIYSDCFMSSQIREFNQLGYILYKLNHSVCLEVVVSIPIILRGYGVKLRA